MATVNLGSIKFNWQGAYDNATAYAVDDVVSSGGNSYICIAATTGNTPPNATYWELMAQAGTNGTDGTDLTTTLTTQGDLVYRDASGLARLGAGTSGQVLTTGGAGANPSWGTVSSDYVLLATADANNTATKVSFDGYFSSTYKNYKLIGSNITIASGQSALRVRFRRSNAEVTASNYYHVAVRYYIVDAGLSAVGGTAASSALLVNENTSSTSGYNSSFTLDLYDPLGTNNYKNATFQTIGFDTGGDNRHHFENGGLGLTDSTSALSGITIDQAGGVNITRGNFKLYGIK